MSAEGVTRRPPNLISAADNPDDAGGAVELKWEKSPGDNNINKLVSLYLVYRSESPLENYDIISELPSGTTHFTDSDDALINGKKYYYIVAAVYPGDTLFCQPSRAAIPKPQFFHTKRTLVLIFMLLYTGTTILFIKRARKGRAL